MMTGYVRRICVGAAIFAAVGCGTGANNSTGAGSGSGGSTGTGPVPLSTFCPDLIADQASQLNKCIGGPVDLWTAQLEAGFSCTDIEAAVTAGHLKYSSAQSGNCLSSITDESCDDLVNATSEPAPCTATIAGTIAAGGTCYNSTECSGSADFCQIPAGTCSGTCVPLVASGAACMQGDECVAGYYCDPSSSTCLSFSTLPPDSDQGEHCGEDATSGTFTECAAGLACDIVLQQCVPVVREGQGCYGGHNTCENFTDCHPTALCTPYGDGGACQTSGLCVVFPSDAGAECGVVQGGDPVGCLGPLFCNTQFDGGNGAIGFCTPLKADGAPCHGNEECASGGCSGDYTTPGTCYMTCTLQ